MVQLYVENSKSKSGKHAIRTLLYKVVDGKLIEVKDEGNKVSPTYKVGEAKVINISDNGTYIYVKLVKNIYNKIIGEILVIDNNSIVLKLKYRKLKIKKIEGDEKYFDKVKELFEKLKIPIKRANLK
ncbi:hypothetical protein D1867_01455 [Acidianus infernus]|uniref:Uncharacterized protein n=1 Tax=Acidianus infernus TaxID=12915 RepID=A0A6A9QAK7_ACIIN|nr:hypothetical protein [Acidianus infernus]MCY0873473.1 hypothetical protein [Acidianus infernus]MCY0882473.1 hypothetical protein [Acidianus infernus]MUM63939.1 hypothetical protein [Acidianus infernus]